MRLLIDADSMLWRSALGIQTESFDGTTHSIPDPEDGYMTFMGRVENLCAASGIKEYTLAMSCGESFRKLLHPAYKAHRPPPPPIVNQVKKLIVARESVVLWPGLEGDDIVGMHADLPDIVLYSEDKDLQQIACLHWSWDLMRPYRISYEEGMRFFYSQVLTGDSTDNYKGCPGIGPGKAKVLLEGVPVADMWDLVCMTYQIRGSTESAAFLQAQLAWILRTGPEGILPFTPPPRRTTLGKVQIKL